jgi:hypothetical protein
MADCPFALGDRVLDEATHHEATVERVDEDRVFCRFDNGILFYRTWSHELDTLFHQSGGGLTRLHRPDPQQPERKTAMKCLFILQDSSANLKCVHGELAVDDDGDFSIPSLAELGQEEDGDWNLVLMLSLGDEPIAYDSDGDEVPNEYLVADDE